MKSVRIHTDGGARGNPGPAGIGVVIYDEHARVRYGYGDYIGETTNNQAEYRALVFALERAVELGAEEARCFLDSELIVKQLHREYRVRDTELGKLFLKVWNLASKFKKITFTHVMRSSNKEADAFVNQAIDRRGFVSEVTEMRG